MKHKIENFETTVKKRGGKREGSGAKKKIEKVKDLSNYDRCLGILDGLAPHALKTLENAMNGDDKTIAVRAAQIVLSKYLPEKIDFKGIVDSSINIIIEGVKAENTDT